MTSRFAISDRNFTEITNKSNNNKIFAVNAIAANIDFFLNGDDL